MFFHSPYKLVHVGCRSLLFFKSLRKIRNPFFQFRLLGGVLVDQLQAHVFGDLTCDLFFERRAYELIEFCNAPFRSLEFSFDIGLVFVREPCGMLQKLPPEFPVVGNDFLRFVSHIVQDDLL